MTSSQFVCFSLHLFAFLQVFLGFSLIYMLKKDVTYINYLILTAITIIVSHILIYSFYHISMIEDKKKCIYIFLSHS